MTNFKVLLLTNGFSRGTVSLEKHLQNIFFISPQDKIYTTNIRKHSWEVFYVF